MTRRRCTTPGCPEPAQAGGACTTHRRTRTRWTGGGDRTFYNSKAWRQLSAQVRDEQRFCPGIGDQPCGKPTTDTDHIHPLTTHPDLALEPSNLRALCHECHSTHTARTTRLGQRTRE